MNKNSSLFNNRIITIGIDTHLKSNRATYLVDGQFYKTCTHPGNVNEIIKYVHKHFPGASYQSAYEAGFSGFHMHYKLVAAGIDNIVVHANDIPLTQKNKEQKTDARDSRQIAHCLYAGLLIGIHVPSEKQQADRALVRHRDCIVSHLTRIRNRITMNLHFQGIEIPAIFKKRNVWCKAFINWLTEMEFEQESNRFKLDIYLLEYKQYRELLLSVNRKLRALGRSEYYHENYKLLLKIPGIGLVGAMRFLTEIGSIKDFPTQNQLCSYVGLIPNSRSSGEKEYKGKITKRGKKKLRSQLIEGAWIAIHHDPSLMAYFAKKVNGKKNNRNRAIVSTARKLLCRIYFILTNQVEYKKNMQ